MTEEYQIQEHNSAFSLSLSLSLVSHSLVRFLYISFLGILLYIIRKKLIKYRFFERWGEKNCFHFLFEALWESCGLNNAGPEIDT